MQQARAAAHLLQAIYEEHPGKEAAHGLDGGKLCALQLHPLEGLACGDSEAAQDRTDM